MRDLPSSEEDRNEWTRRAFLQIGAATSGVLMGEFLSDASGLPPARATAPERAEETMVAALTLRVNGRRHELVLDTRTSLLDALREHLGLTGTKKGCDHGQCGACTVLVNGRRINACLTLAAMIGEDEITTIEGLGIPGDLHPLQAAFIRHDGFQCGYCTPGQICSAVAMLSEMAAHWPSHATRDVASETIVPSDAELRERMSGNLCRCSAYPNILAAIRDVMGRTP
jgi:xanthine dehydrogenase YagT iron-sulfur-binding subunit